MPIIRLNDIDLYHEGEGQGGWRANRGVAARRPPREQMETYNALLSDFLRGVDAERRDNTYQRPNWSLVEYFHSLNAA
ncbi:MAG: hypothetical protein K2P94_16385 [Rhodospirillaceae bacterium]|nr:hypothetical protein [Rhodospirillaceae bacterium]